MLDKELRDKIARLPVWARELIYRLDVRSEPAVEEAARARKEAEALREQVRKLKDRVEAMCGLFSSAALAGHEGAINIMRVLEDYEIYQPLKARDQPQPLDNPELGERFLKEGE